MQISLGISLIQAAAVALLVLQPMNLARTATATASSSYSGSYAAANVNDGSTATEWASSGQANPWVTLTWSSPVTSDSMTFFDRSNTSDFVQGGVLTFSDGSTVNVSGIDNAGAATKINFAARTFTSVKFQTTTSGSNPGLAEWQVWSVP